MLRLQVGNLKLSGRAAAAVALVLLLAIAALIVIMRPRVGMLISGTLWVGFVLYWSAAARNAASIERSESRESRRFHARLLNVALLLLFIPVPGLRGRILSPEWFLLPAGLVLQSAGFLLAVWARRHLGANWSGAIARTVGHRLVRSGPYRLLRHPIYSAMFAMFIGTAVVSGEWHSLLAVVILAAAYWRKVRLEERHLREEFGTDYDDYRRHTWALIPGLF